MGRNSLCEMLPTAVIAAYRMQRNRRTDISCRGMAVGRPLQAARALPLATGMATPCDTVRGAHGCLTLCRYGARPVTRAAARKLC